MVVVTEESIDNLLHINHFCRNHGIQFISGDIRGVFAYAFTDFGDEFTVLDPRGEQPTSYMIEGITKEGLVTVAEDAKLDIQSGYVTFSDIEGTHELNGCRPIKISNAGDFSFSIGDISQLSPYVKGGRVIESIIPVTVKFSPLAKQIAAPTLQDCGFKDLTQLHIAFLALDKFKQNYSRLPYPRDEMDASNLIELAKTVNSQYNFTQKLDETVLKQFSYTAIGSISPMAAFLGGIISQEVLKAITGKFTPIQQFLYFDAVEALPENLTADDCFLIGS